MLTMAITTIPMTMVAMMQVIITDGDDDNENDNDNYNDDGNEHVVFPFL